MLLWNEIELVTSKRCWFFLSANPFYCGVYTPDDSCMMPFDCVVRMCLVHITCLFMYLTCLPLSPRVCLEPSEGADINTRPLVPLYDWFCLNDRRFFFFFLYTWVTIQCTRLDLRFYMISERIQVWLLLSFLLHWPILL